MLSTSVSKSVGSVLHIFYVLLTDKAVQGAKCLIRFSPRTRLATSP